MRHEGGRNSENEGSSWKQLEDSVAKDEDSFQVELRVHGVSQEVILKDQERMTKIQTLVDKLPDAYQTKSIINDLGEKAASNTLSEAFKRTIKELGNIELYELGEISKTVQCPSCLKYSNSGTVCCSCGITEDDSRGARHGPE